MSSLSRRPGRHIPGIIGLGIMLVLVLLISGCTQPAATPTVPATTQIPAAVTTTTPVVQATTMTAERKRLVTFTEADNGKTENIAHSTRFAVALAENPTTGFTWNATLSPGLELQSSDFRQSPAAPGMVGVGGTRTWIIIAKDPGDQKFSAAYRRSWEPVSGNETSYGVNINVVAI